MKPKSSPIFIETTQNVMTDNNKIIPIITGKKNKNGDLCYFVKICGKISIYNRGECDVCKKEIKKIDTFYVKKIYSYHLFDSITTNYCEECGSRTKEYINYMFEKIT